MEDGGRMVTLICQDVRVPSMYQESTTVKMGALDLTVYKR